MQKWGWEFLPGGSRVFHDEPGKNVCPLTRDDEKIDGDNVRNAPNIEALTPLLVGK